MTELLQDWVTLQAQTRPHASAVVAQDERLTYDELNAHSNRLARLLQAAGCRRGDRVCLLMPKSLTALVAILGTYKADCILVPLDPSSPAVQLRRVLEWCDSRCVMAAAPFGGTLEQLFGRAAPSAASPVIGWLGHEPPPALSSAAQFVLEDLRAYSSAPLQYHNTRRDPAHILCTSGSTDAPQGVVITHGNLIHFVEWARRYFGMSTSDRLSWHSPLHVDLSMFDIVGTFAAGAELHLVPPELDLLPHKLADFIRASELTQWLSVPSVLDDMAKLDSVESDDFPTLKRLMWCGEVFPTPALMYWMKRLPHVTFTSLYGPIEATIASGYHTVGACPEDPSAELPIGTGRDGEELLVLNDTLDPVPPGEIGDLYIRGVGLSPGFWKDPERTGAVFVRNPRGADSDDRLYRTGDLARTGPDGLVYVVGRVESRTRNRRHRIGLGETGVALGALDEVGEAAVLGISENARGHVDRLSLRGQFRNDIEARTV
jgi:amino acid adenylation domain-containing protein